MGAFLRAVKAELYRPAMEPQDYQMVEFFIKRLKLSEEDGCGLLADPHSAAPPPPPPPPPPIPDLQLDRLLPGVDAMLSGFERVARVTEEVHCLEVSLEEAQSRARERR
ncbi:hypothetical protein CRUP_018969, partial [Coryphaenoides rupestris]